MISVTVHYRNILRQRAGMDHENLELPNGVDVSIAVRRLAGRHGPGLAEMLLSPAGEVSHHLVIFVNRQRVLPGQHSVSLAGGDEIVLFPTISGG